MHDLTIAGSCFDGMADSVAKVQVQTNALIQLVFNHDFSLDFAGAVNDIFCMFKDTVNAPVHLLQIFPQLDIIDEAIFDNLTHSFNQFSFTQCFQGLGIDEDTVRLIEGTDHIFGEGGVDPRFSTDRRINLSGQAGRNLQEVDTPHIGSGHKACQITDNSASQGNDAIAPCHAFLDQKFIGLIDGFQIFGAFSFGENKGNTFKTCLFKAGFNGFQIERGYMVVCNNGNFLWFPKIFDPVANLG